MNKYDETVASDLLHIDPFHANREGEGCRAPFAVFCDRDSVAASASAMLPSHIRRQGERASRRFLEFFAAEIENENTRRAYFQAVTQFFDWCESRGVRDLARIEPVVVAAFIKTEKERRGRDGVPTIKLQLSAIRRLFDYLVTGRIIDSNPALSVRGPRHQVGRGKTPVLARDEARHLLDSIPIYKEKKPDLVGLRDRALIALMVYSFARISAVVSMRVGDYYPVGKRFWIRLHEKGGKEHEVPMHHLAEEYLDTYLLAAGIGDDKKAPLWRSARGRSGLLGEAGVSRSDAFRMIRRRAAVAGLPNNLGCHTFRATGITAYLLGGGTLEGAQKIAAHSSPRTTRLYDRRSDEITLAEIEKIQL